MQQGSTEVCRKGEILATQLLRFLHEECRLIIQVGVNAEGQTIISPSDGFVRALPVEAYRWEFIGGPDGAPRLSR